MIIGTLNCNTRARRELPHGPRKTMDGPPHGRRLEQMALPNYFFGYVSAGLY
jgi:hypothetical protein